MTCLFLFHYYKNDNIFFLNNFFYFLFQGSCFPPSFGGKCSGIPHSCQPCLEPCKSYTGKIITVNLNDSGNYVVRLFVFLSFYIFVSLFLSLFVFMSICLYVSLSLCLFVFMSLCLCVSLSLCLFVFMSICLSVYLHKILSNF